MKIEDSVYIKNYKCFGEAGSGFEQIFPINVIIGKNNSGKSSLIDLVQFLTENDKNFLTNSRDGKSIKVEVKHRLTKEDIGRVFKTNERNQAISKISNYNYGIGLVDADYTYHLGDSNERVFNDINEEILPASESLVKSLSNYMEVPLRNKSFCKITAERDIVPETNSNHTTINLVANGSGATHMIQQIINSTDEDSNLIERELLDELNNIINPDIDFSRILVQHIVTQNKWEVFFEDQNDNRIALSKMGSGVKTILLVLLNLIVRPKIEDKSKGSYVFSFEELENNLHPSLQRRLFSYINEYSSKNSAFFFLTTHSNVVIDTFGVNPNAQLIHISHDKNESNVKSIDSLVNTKNLLVDLGVKASDLLQSNGVIWVEGPSDRIYINSWIKLVSPELVEGTHYMIMFYGGRLLSNLSFNYDWFDAEVIPLIRINSNAYVVMDRDGKTIKTRLNNTKIRIAEEIGEGKVWITKGREIENYLSPKCISDWLLNEHKVELAERFKNDVNSKLEDSVQLALPDIKLKYNLSKNTYSSEITKYFEQDSLEILDLKAQVELLIENIKKWNE